MVVLSVSIRLLSVALEAVVVDLVVAVEAVEDMEEVEVAMAVAEDTEEEIVREAEVTEGNRAAMEEDKVAMAVAATLEVEDLTEEASNKAVNKVEDAGKDCRL